MLLGYPQNTETIGAPTCSHATTICIHGHIINFCYIIQAEKGKERESKREVEMKFLSVSLPNFVKFKYSPPEYLKKSRWLWGRRERLWDSISYQYVWTEKTPDQKQWILAVMDVKSHRSLLGSVGRPKGMGPRLTSCSSEVHDNDPPGKTGNEVRGERFSKTQISIIRFEE